MGLETYRNKLGKFLMRLCWSNLCNREKKNRCALDRMRMAGREKVHYEHATKNPWISRFYGNAAESIEKLCKI